jgi:tRNA-dihydrouridine synthase
MAVKSFRSHLVWYSRGIAGGAQFRQEVMTADCFNKTSDLLNAFFSQITLIDTNHDSDGIDYRQAFG